MNERRGAGLVAMAHAAPGQAPRGAAAAGHANAAKASARPASTGQASPGLAIEATGLIKSYKDVHVLSGVDIGVPAGTVFALLGPNGAGKTTTVRILATLVQADGGQARVAGFDVAKERSKVRRRISLTGQFAALDEVQTGTENLRMMGRLSRLTRTQAREP